MKMEEDNMIFNVSKELQFGVGGDFQKTATLEFAAPSSKVLDEALDLSQMVMGSMMDSKGELGDEIKASKETEESEDGKEDEPIDPDSVKALIMSGQKIKASVVMAKFDVIALKSGTFDGKVRITETTLKQLSLSDHTRLMCEYIANFIIPSLV